MKRKQADLVSGVVTPRTQDFAATERTYVANPGWHPPSYMSWDRVQKAAPAHYACCAGNEDQPSAWVYPQAIDLCGAGFVQLIRWSAIEPASGAYNFSAVTTALTWMAANKPGKKLYVRLRDKSYSSSNGAANFLTDTARNMPDFMDGHVYQVYQGGSPSGFGPKVWEAFVRDKMIALVQAMGAAFGAHESFGGVIMDESTLSMSWPYPADYVVADSIANRKQVLLATKAAFPGKDVVQPYNYFDSGDMGASTYGTEGPAFVSWCASNGIQLSLVDTCPTTASFIFSMSEVLATGLPVFAIVDAGRVYPRTDMTAGVEVANVTGNFSDIKGWYQTHENISAVFWPIANSNTLTALQAVLP